MSGNYGDILAQEIWKRIAAPVAAEADIDDIPETDRVNGMSVKAISEGTTWTYKSASTSSAGTYVIVPADNPSTGRWHMDYGSTLSTVSGLAADISGLTCLSGDAVGDAVYISAASTVAKADADDTSKIPAIGLIISKQSSTSCTVRVSGLVTGLTSLTAGSIYYLSTTAGAITATAPSAPNAVPIGIAVSTTTLFVFGSLGAAFMLLRAKGLLNATRTIGVKLSDLRIVTSGGAVGNIAAIGGMLASNSDPSQTADGTTHEWYVNWAANSVVPVGFHLSLPADFDDTQDVSLELDIASGSTDAATMGVATSWQGGSEVTDSADDSGTKSATRHTITATIDKGDIPASKHVTFRLTPPSHSTNAIKLFGVRVVYTPKAA